MAGFGHTSLPFRPLPDILFSDYPIVKRLSRYQVMVIVVGCRQIGSDRFHRFQIQYIRFAAVDVDTAPSVGELVQRSQVV